MRDLLLNDNVAYTFLLIFVLLMFAQTYILLRIRNILNAISLNFESIIYFCRKFAQTSNESKPASTIPRTCQFCKHRLAYINTSKTRNEEEDFYHVCGLKNVNITLTDSCEKFEKEDDVKA